MLTQGVFDKPYPGEYFEGGFEWGAITVSYLQIMIVTMTIVLP